MKRTTTFLAMLSCMQVFALDGNHFTLTRISAPYFIVDGNNPSAITKAYVGFEITNNSNSGVNYSNLKFTITSITTSVTGQNYTLVSPATGIFNIGSLTPGQSRTCYFYVEYPANVTPQATFNVLLNDNNPGTKTQSFVIYNRSSISANAGGTATQTFTSQNGLGTIVTDDVTYLVGNVQNGDENDFQVAVSTAFDPTKITLLSTEVLSSSVPGISAGTTDSIYFISGNGSNGASITIRWTFRITATNFTTYLLPCAGATSGGTNYKYALNTALGQGTPITVGAGSNSLTLTKTSDQSLYGPSAPSIFTITMKNTGSYDVSVDSIVDELPAGFTFQSFHATSQVNSTNSTSYPANGSSGNIRFEGGVLSGSNVSYYIPAGDSIFLRYIATTRSTSASNLTTTARIYVGSTEAASGQNTVSVSSTLPVDLLFFKAGKSGSSVVLDWATSAEWNTSSFEVERSANGQNFEKIISLQAKGGNGTGALYQATDPAPFAGSNFYRLKIRDLDGRFIYSQVVSVQIPLNDVKLECLYPNPFRHSPVMKLSAPGNQVIPYTITDMAGRVLQTGKLEVSAGTFDYTLNELNKYPAGNFIFTLYTREKMIFKKLVKQ